GVRRRGGGGRRGLPASVHAGRRGLGTWRWLLPDRRGGDGRPRVFARRDSLALFHWRAAARALLILNSSTVTSWGTACTCRCSSASFGASHKARMGRARPRRRCFPEAAYHRRGGWLIIRTNPR